MQELENKLNYDSVYFRDLTKSVIHAFQDKIWWINDFLDEARLVTVPFYYSMTGDENFLIDAFVDDVPSQRVELNTDIIPRAHITMNSSNAEFGQIRNPHVWLKSSIESNEEMFQIYSKVKAIPLTTNFDVEIRLTSEIDIWKCHAKILDVFSLYKYMDFEHRGIYIEAQFALPDGTDVEIPRELDLGTDNNKSIKFSVDVKSYYPAIDLGYNGSLNEFKKLIQGEEFITKPGVFGTKFHLANKKVNWNVNLHRVHKDDLYQENNKYLNKGE